jgi:hypothetical protein
MSLRSAALAGLLLLGSVTATVSVPANAATTECGAQCASLLTERYNAADFMAAGQELVSGNHSGTGAGRPVVLAAAGQYATEDWQIQLLGTAAELAADGVVTTQVGRAWPQSLAYQYSYTPDGRSTGLCLGVAGQAGSGTPVTLQPCGTPLDTVWVKIEGAPWAYGALVSGSDTQTIVPAVLTADAPGSQLTTGFLDFVRVRQPAPDQLWKAWFGPY